MNDGTWGLLGRGDVHSTTKVSEQNQTASDVSTKASEWKGNGSEQDQDGSRSDNSSPAARDQNNVCVCAVTPAVRDQNNDVARDMSREYNKENTCDDHDQKINKVNGTRDERGGKHNTQMTKMTYREALTGVDNAELCSDF